MFHCIGTKVYEKLKSTYFCIQCFFLILVHNCMHASKFTLPWHTYTVQSMLLCTCTATLGPRGGGHSALKWVRVFSTKRGTLGLKNRFLAKIGAKELEFLRIFEVKSWNSGDMGFENSAAKFKKFVLVKNQEVRKLGSSHGSKLQLGVWWTAREPKQVGLDRRTYPYCHPFMWVRPPPHPPWALGYSVFTWFRWECMCMKVLSWYVLGQA